MTHRVLAILSAVLFGLFVAQAAILLAASVPHTSCAGVVALYPGETVEMAGSNWVGIPADHCVETSPNLPNRATDRGLAPTSHEGEGWVVYRLALGAWLAWSLAMLLLAAAVAAIPRRRRDGTT